VTHLALLALHAILRLDDATPSPAPAFTGNEDLITPGVVGFGVTFLIAVVTVLLLVDMTRRMRRLRYRSEIRQKLEDEAAAGATDETKPGAATPPKR
jgi:hypothetical protein